MNDSTIGLLVSVFFAAWATVTGKSRFTITGLTLEQRTDDLWAWWRWGNVSKLRQSTRRANTIIKPSRTAALRTMPSLVM
jgi:hypothetical protein